MSAKIENSQEVTSLKAIAQFEARHGVLLPAEYKQFLLNYNGGEPVPGSFDVPSWRYKASCMDVFFGIHSGKNDSLDGNCKTYVDRIPSTLIPVGNDAFGNAICLGVKGEQRGKVYFWDHEDELDENGEGRQDYGNVYLVANSFDEFLDKLREPKPD